MAYTANNVKTTIKKKIVKWYSLHAVRLGPWNVHSCLILLVQWPRNANGTNLGAPERRSGAFRLTLTTGDLDLWHLTSRIQSGHQCDLLNILCKFHGFHGDCSSRLWDIMVTRSVERTNKQTDERTRWTDCRKTYDTIRYDTIRSYDMIRYIYVHSKADDMASLI